MSESVQTFFSRIRLFFVSETRPERTNRSRAGLLLTLALMPLLLGVLACYDLPVPVGDPEKSRIDPALSGIWIGYLADDDAVIFVLDPYDKRTWLLSFISLDTGQDSEPTGEENAGADQIVSKTSPLRFLHPDYEHPVKVDDFALFKSWLTKIKGVTFITWESKNLSGYSDGMVPDSWLVLRVRQSDEGVLYLDMFDTEADGLDKVETRKEAEKIIRRHVNDPEFYSPFMELYKVPESDYKKISGLMKDFGIKF